MRIAPRLNVNEHQLAHTRLACRPTCFRARHVHVRRLALRGLAPGCLAEENVGDPCGVDKRGRIRRIAGVSDNLARLGMLHAQGVGLDWVVDRERSDIDIIYELALARLPWAKGKSIGHVIDAIDLIGRQAPQVCGRSLRPKAHIARGRRRCGVKATPHHQGRKIQAVIGMQVAKGHVRIAGILLLFQLR